MTTQNNPRDERTPARALAEIKRRLHALETAPRAGNTSIGSGGMQSTDYVPGVSGWRINGDGSAELNDADFRGDVLVGPAGGPQVHVYSGSGAGRVDFLSADAAEDTPGRVVSGIFGSGLTRRIETNYYSARFSPTGDRAVIVQYSEDLAGAGPMIELGTINSAGGFDPKIRVDSAGVQYPAQPGGFMTLNTAPTAAGDGTWHAFTNGSWSSIFPYTRACPSSESIAFDIYMRANNRASVNATVGLSVQVKAGSTVLWQPANSDTDSCALDQNDGTTIIAASNYRRVQRTIIIGRDILNTYSGQTLTITPMYRVSSGTSYTYAAASLTTRDIPDPAISTVFS
ncbi:MAG: hypothetical protein ACRDP6_14650 [Actinoallomurus sp.]